MAQSRRYAERTKVSEGKSRSDIEAELQRHNCAQTAVMTEACGCYFAFAKDDRMYRIGITLPEAGSRDRDQERRRRMRTLALYIKGRLHAVEDGLLSFEEEFQPDVVMHDGRTLKEHAAEQLKQVEHKGGTQRRLALPGV